MNLPAVYTDVPALLDRELLALAEIRDVGEMARAERRLAAIAELAKRAGLATPIQNKAMLLRAKALAGVAELVDEGQAAGEINSRGRPGKDPRSGSLPVRPQRLHEGRALARSGVIDEARAKAEADPERPLSMAELLRQAQRRERDSTLRERRLAAEEEARTAGLRVEIVEADLRDWRPIGVDAIVTDPPYITADAVELHAALADFALDVLPDGGALVVMTSQAILADVLAAMRRPALVYRWAIAWVFGTSERTPERQRRTFDGWKPILVFHKTAIPGDATYLYDVVRSDHLDKSAHEWGQSIDGFRQLVRAACGAGQTICDPFVGGGTTAVAALAEARHFLGCDIDPGAVAVARGRIER